MTARWIEFVETKNTGKTKVFEVVTQQDKTFLGQIKWFGRWRKYAFFPATDTVYEQDCLLDIHGFLIDLMVERRKGRRLM